MTSKQAVLAPIVDTCLSRAWCRAYLSVKAAPHREVVPFLASIATSGGGSWSEDSSFREIFDNCLSAADSLSVRKVAWTIFPHQTWLRCGGDREKLYATYLECLPDYVGLNKRANRFGIYFARLIGYDIDPVTGQRLSSHSGVGMNGNQLEFIISNCKPGVQRMALQAGIFDPLRDQTDARRHFPCLQHVTFVPNFERQSITLNAFYALQQLFTKAYGNWLGLLHLGQFVAEQVGLELEAVNCYAGVQKMPTESLPKDSLLRKRLDEAASQLAASTHST